MHDQAHRSHPSAGDYRHRIHRRLRRFLQRPLGLSGHFARVWAFWQGPDVSEERHPRAHLALSLTGACVGLFWFALTADGSLGSSLFVVLAGSAAISGLLATTVTGRLVLSTTFALSMLAAAFLGPAAAFAVAIVGELADWLRVRYPVRSVVMNIGGVGLPALAAGAVF